MSLELLGIAVPLVLAIVGTLIRIGKLVQTVKDLTRRVQELEDDADIRWSPRTKGRDE